MRKAACWFAAVMLAGAVPGLLGQSGDSKEPALEKIDSAVCSHQAHGRSQRRGQAGSIVALQKDGLLVYTVTVPSAPISVYKNGKLSQASATR